jgi:PiT family inorganic phosphate transporter
MRRIKRSGSSMLVALLVLATLFVAYSNGANDNFKGVATLYGSRAATFQTALWIGTLATLAGCICSVFLAEALVKAFSGKGLVPDTVSESPRFLMAVAAGAASTVMLATVLGFPISTTHALTGGLVGAGWVAAGPALNLSVLGETFFLPLLVSPVLSLLFAMPLYRLAHEAVGRLGLVKETCICIGPRQFVPVAQFTGDRARQLSRTAAPVAGLAISLDTTAACVQRYGGRIAGVTAQTLVDVIHFTSGAAVSFARGLNDTPKIVGLLLVVKALDFKVSMLALALAMAIGGLLNSRKVAVTMSDKISRMNDGQALTANLVTAFMVIGASRFGVPVSTTHVSVGAISGVGLVKGTSDTRVIASVVMSWVATLPIAAILAAIAYIAVP